YVCDNDDNNNNLQIALAAAPASQAICLMVCTYRGYCYTSPQPTVRPGVTEMCLFGKTSGCATGSVGFLTYNVVENEKHIFDCLFKNFFLHLGMFEKDKFHKTQHTQEMLRLGCKPLHSGKHVNMDK
uniref:Uncharacterized protein n=1 Tax=Scleropages formosus TaxID=113540 RepID=A0A8C9RC04_SCLFO